MRADPPDRNTDAFLSATRRLRRVVAGLGFAPADADDILQGVYLTLRTRPPQWQGVAALEHWLYRTTVNACHQEYRRRARFRRASPRLWQATGDRTDPAAGEAVGGAEQRERVRRALIELDVDLAVPLVLRYFCGWDATRIGSLLELPPSTVRARLRRARLWLADALTE